MQKSLIFEPILRQARSIIAWLRLLLALLAFHRVASPNARDALAESLALVKSLPATPRGWLALKVHQNLLALDRSRGNNLPRHWLWPIAIEINQECIRAGHRAHPNSVKEDSAYNILIASQSAHHAEPLPQNPRQSSRVEFFWSMVASDESLDLYWTSEKCAELEYHSALCLAEILALSCISKNSASPRAVDAMERILMWQGADNGCQGPFTALAAHPLVSTDRWLYEGWPEDLSGLADDLAKLHPPSLLDLLCLAHQAPLGFQHYLCPASGRSLWDSLQSIASARALSKHMDALIDAIHSTPPRTSMPPTLRAAIEAFALAKELESGAEAPIASLGALRI